MFHRIVILLCLTMLISCSNKHDKTGSAVVNQEEQVPKNITFRAHVAKIIHSKCSNCHRPGESGPFPLISYEDVYKRKKTIVKVTHNGYMPPWPADRGYSNFVGELYLTETEKTIIKNWVDQGAKEGSKEIVLSQPIFPNGSQIGKPDLVIKLPKPYVIKGNNKDHYVIMKVPYEIPNDKYVKTIEFVPGNRKRVHHVNGYLINYDEGKKKNLYGGEFFVNNYESSMEDVWKRLDVLNDDGSYPVRIPSATNFLPGVLAPYYPDGIGGFLMKKKGLILFNDIHYGPTSVDEEDNSYMNVFFAKNPPERRFGEFQLGTYGLSEIRPALMVPPDSIKTFNTQYTVQEDISIVTINPHMHLLGKSFIAYAITPEGLNIPLIRIPKWDFRWQYFYTFKKMVKIPKGTTIYVKATFDNTRQNPNNPYNPPRWVGEREGSMSTKDEMLQFIITYLPYRNGDEDRSLDSSTVVNKNK